MKIGLLSDTHGNVTRTIRAAHLFRTRGAEIVIHCGDIGSEGPLIALVEILAPFEIHVHAVLGNVDIEAYTGAGVHLSGRFGELEITGKKIAIIHGDDFSRLQQVLAGQRYDYIFTGHTHARESSRRGRTRVVNPGAVHRSAHPCIALLNLSDDSLVWIDL